MFALAAFVLCGAVITTLVQAEELDSVRAAPPSGYLQPTMYQDTVVEPSQHRWLQPANRQGRVEPGAYRMYSQQLDRRTETHETEAAQARVSFNLGDLRHSRDAHRRSMMSDWERDQYRRNGAWFSMSVGRQW